MNKSRKQECIIMLHYQGTMTAVGGDYILRLLAEVLGSFWLTNPYMFLIYVKNTITNNISLRIWLGVIM